MSYIERRKAEGFSLKGFARLCDIRKLRVSFTNQWAKDFASYTRDELLQKLEQLASGNKSFSVYLQDATGNDRITLNFNGSVLSSEFDTDFRVSEQLSMQDMLFSSRAANAYGDAYLQALTVDNFIEQGCDVHIEEDVLTNGVWLVGDVVGTVQNQQQSNWLAEG